jgi:hypothetical protein
VASDLTLYIPAVAAAVGAIAGAMLGAYLKGVSDRGQWLRDKRYGTYLDYYNAWEDCLGVLQRDDSTPKEKGAAFDMLWRSARAVDLVGDSEVRNYAWRAEAFLRQYEVEGEEPEGRTKVINECLNAFKLHLSVVPSRLKGGKGL